MITALSTPESGRVILDGNTTLISVQSTNGEGHFFRAKIFINGELFDQQGWSRIDAYTATKDLKKLYSAYYAPVFNSTFANQLQEQTHLSRYVSILVEEYSISTGELTASLELPGFYVMHNIRPETFSDTEPIRLLGVDAQQMVVPEAGKIAMPFYVNTSAGNIRVELRDQFGTLINMQDNGYLPAGKRAFLYQFDLSPVALSYATKWLTLSIYTPSEGLVQVLTYRILRNADHPVKEIAFRNNFGYYLYAYADGELETQSGLEVETYETAGGSEKVYEINEEETYTINTGSYLAKEKAIIPMIATSPDTKLKNGSTWLDIVAATKKLLTFRDRKHNYSDTLQFTRRKGTDIANSGFITVEGAQPDIEITDIDVTGNIVTIAFALHNGYAPPTITIQLRNSPAGTWFSNTGAAISPRSFTYAQGNYQVRLRDSANPAPASDIHDITIE